MTEQKRNLARKQVSNSTEKSVLIVEDEAIVAADLQVSLNQLGYRVCGIYDTGTEAIAGVRQYNPDIVLMDIHLAEDMDGIETAEAINAEFDIPVIYLTAMADDQTLQRAKITTPFGYILKPFETDNLHSTMEMALYKHELDIRLRQSEERYRSLFEYSPVPLVELDLSSVKQLFDRFRSLDKNQMSAAIEEHWQDIMDAAKNIRINYFNQAMAELSQVDKTEDYLHLIKRNIMQTRLVEYAGLINTYFNPGTDRDIEITHTRLDGSQFCAIMKTTTLPGSEQTWDRIIYSLYDISERAEAESALKHRLKVEEMVSDISSRFVNISPQNLDEEINNTLQILGQFSNVQTCYFRLYESDGITLGHCVEWRADGAVSVKNDLTGESHEPYHWLNERMDRGETVYLPDIDLAPEEAAPEKEVWHRYDIGSILQLPLIIQQKTVGFMGFNRNKTEALLHELDIKLYRMVADIISNALERIQTEEAYHILIDHASIELFIMQDDELIFANQAACNGNHTTFEEIRGWSFEDFITSIHEDDRELARQMFSQVNRGEPVAQPFEIRVVHRDGSVRWLETTITLIEYLRRPAQQITQIDITESKTAQQALQQSEARLQALFERAGIGITICNLQGCLIMANPQFGKLVGYDHAELMTMTCSSLTHPDDVRHEEEVISRLLNGEADRFQIEKRFFCKDGSVKWGRVTITIIHYNEGDERLVVKMIEDISENKLAEEALKNSEERLRLVLDGSRDGFWDWDITNGEVIFSKRWAEMRGFKLEEVEPSMQSWETMIHPNDLHTVHRTLQEHLEQDNPQFECEYRIMTKFGEWKWILDRGVALFDENGSAVRMTGTQTDITERKQMDVALQESEARFRAIYDNSGVGIALTDKRGDILLSNPAFQKMLGYTPAVLQNMTFYDITHPEDVRPNQELTWALHAKKIESFQLTKRYMRSNGDTMWGHLTVTPVKDDNDNILFVIGMIEDITEQKDAEEALRESEQKLRGLISESRDGIMITDEYGIIIEWNRALEDICSLPANQTLGRPLWEIQHKIQAITVQPKNTYEKIMREIRMALEKGEAIWMNRLQDIEIHTLDGKDRCLQTVIFPVKTAKGHMICIIGRDVTEARKLETMLRRGKEEWEATVNALSEMILLTDSSGIILRTNRSAQDFFSMYNIQAVGQPIDSVFQSITGSKTISSLDNENFFEEAELWLHIKSYTLNVDQEAAGTVYVIRDITKEKEMESALMASQKLSSLGTLVAGLAHEMNSPLQVIISTSESLLKQLQQEKPPDEEHMQNYLEMIQRNAWRNAEIVRSLRLYTSSSQDHIEEINMNSLIQDVLLLMQNRLGSQSGINVTTDLDQDIPLLPCNRNKFSQVLINLLINAVDAIPEQGNITISTRHDEEQNNIVLSVQDDGVGIDDDIQPRVFDPFFTTKPVGSGLGLGLSIVLGIVKGSGGEIGLESAPGKGTTFTLYLPLQRKDAQQTHTIEPEFGRYDDSALRE